MSSILKTDFEVKTHCKNSLIMLILYDDFKTPLHNFHNLLGKVKNFWKLLRCLKMDYVVSAGKISSL